MKVKLHSIAGFIDRLMNRRATWYLVTAGFSIFMLVMLAQSNKRFVSWWVGRPDYNEQVALMTAQRINQITGFSTFVARQDWDESAMKEAESFTMTNRQRRLVAADNMEKIANAWRHSHGVVGVWLLNGNRIKIIHFVVNTNVIIPQDPPKTTIATYGPSLFNYEGKDVDAEFVDLRLTHAERLDWLATDLPDFNPVNKELGQLAVLRGLEPIMTPAAEQDLRDRVNFNYFSFRRSRYIKALLGLAGMLLPLFSLRMSYRLTVRF